MPAEVLENGQSLTSEVVPVRDLSESDVDALFAIFARHYDRVSRAGFEADLFEKDWVIRLRGADGTPQGFSTQKLLRCRVRGRDVRAIFSGDTVVDRDSWGSQELVKAWCRFAGNLESREDSPLYWLLICKGYRTYLYLPVFYHRYFPAFDQAPLDDEAEIMRRLAQEKFEDFYDPAAGLLRFPDSLGQLKPALAETPEGRRDDPRVRYFLERNPGYAEGDELVCITRISAENMKGRALRMFMEGRAMPRAMEALAA